MTMKRRLLPLLLLCAATPVAAQDASSYEGITWRQVAERGIEVRGGEATTTVDAPIARVLEQVRDYASYDDYLPHFRQSRVLGERGDRALVYLQVEVLHGAATLWAQVAIRAREENGKHTIEARMMRGNMDAFLARWEVEAVSESRTRVTFTLAADPQIPAPDSVVAGENEKFAKKAIRALRNRLRGS
tara:strand:+ start:265 stop:828 length:564 start_codon:yes stop_codon:yes gene_type:complete